MLLGELIDTYYVPSLETLAPTTRVGYLSTINLHVMPRWEDVEISDIRAYDVERWVSTMTPGKARNCYTTLRRIIRCGISWGLCESDLPQARIRLPKRKHYQPDVLDAKAVTRLLRGFYGHILEPWLIVSVCLGLRRCEACALTWSDIDMRNGAVHTTVANILGHESLTMIYEHYLIPTARIYKNAAADLEHALMK